MGRTNTAIKFAAGRTRSEHTMRQIFGYPERTTDTPNSREVTVPPIVSSCAMLVPAAALRMVAYNP